MGSASGGTMDPPKPFKSIEVIDSRTSQTCKVACMSCIRGHRTTSCGIPVCRSKIFWTVKRPGRPSNSCTCRYGTTGGCKCVVARTACPHKSRKGEKRSGECRCDEQGRFCCLLEPEHWDTLMNLGNPVVEFHSSRDALDAKQTSPKQAQGIRTPSISAGSSYTQDVESPGLPTYQQAQLSPIHTTLPYDPVNAPQTAIIPRFGFMGIGAPQGSPNYSTTDVLTWAGPIASAPQQWPTLQVSQFTPPEPSSCCQGPVSTMMPNGQPGSSFHDDLFTPPSGPSHHPESEPLMDLTLLAPRLPEPMARRADFQEAFNRQQRVSAICQSCGLAGCSCRNCPPVFQNPNDGSWGQGCGRKHARGSPPPPYTMKVPRLHPDHLSATRNAHGAFMTSSSFSPVLQMDENQQFALDHPELIDTPNISAPGYAEFDGKDPDDVSNLNVVNPLDTASDQEIFDYNEYLGQSDQLEHQQRDEDPGDSCCCAGR